MKITELIEILEKAEKIATEDLHKLGVGTIIYNRFPEKVPVGDPTSISFKWVTNKKKPEKDPYLVIRYAYYGVYFKMDISLGMLEGVFYTEKYIATHMTRAVMKFVNKQDFIKREQGRPKGHY